jgi:hypothetical protein
MLGPRASGRLVVLHGWCSGSRVATQTACRAQVARPEAQGATPAPAPRPAAAAPAPAEPGAAGTPAGGSDEDEEEELDMSNVDAMMAEEDDLEG